MKVVLLAGGLGTRMGEESEIRPKPMVEIGGKPVLWHIMKIFAAQGMNEFIICSGYKSEYIKQYFYNYASTNLDFTLTLGQQSSAEFYGSHDEFDWKVTVVDTGLDTLTGGRIKQIQDYVRGESFLCTYGDGIADVNLAQLIEFHEQSNTVATLTTTRPLSRFGIVRKDENGLVLNFEEKKQSSDEISIGYFVFSPEIFGYLDDGPLELQPLQKLSKERQLSAYRHEGFWQPMDTRREAKDLNELWSTNRAPWKIWNNTKS